MVIVLMESHFPHRRTRIAFQLRRRITEGKQKNVWLSFWETHLRNQHEKMFLTIRRPKAGNTSDLRPELYIFLSSSFKPLTQKVHTGFFIWDNVETAASIFPVSHTGLNCWATDGTVVLGDILPRQGESGSSGQKNPSYEHLVYSNYHTELIVGVGDPASSLQ